MNLIVYQGSQSSHSNCKKVTIPKAQLAASESRMLGEHGTEGPSLAGKESWNCALWGIAVGKMFQTENSDFILPFCTSDEDWTGTVLTSVMKAKFLAEFSK